MATRKARNQRGQSTPVESGVSEQTVRSGQLQHHLVLAPAERRMTEQPDELAVSHDRAHVTARNHSNTDSLVKKRADDGLVAKQRQLRRVHVGGDGDERTLFR